MWWTCVEASLIPMVPIWQPINLGIQCPKFQDQIKREDEKSAQEQNKGLNFFYHPNWSQRSFTSGFRFALPVPSLDCCALYSFTQRLASKRKTSNYKLQELGFKANLQPLVHRCIHTSVVSIWSLISMSQQFPSCNLCSGHRWDLVQSLQRFTAKTQTRQGWDCASCAMHDQSRIYD